MSSGTILLYLHGIRDTDREDSWKIPFAEALTAQGYPGLDGVQVIAPKYSNALNGWDEKQTLPAVTITQPGGEAARRNRRDFERRMGAIEFRLGRHDSGDGIPGGEALGDVAVGLPLFRQAHNYIKDPQIRAQVLNLILGKLPTSGRLVIVGHSLGSVIAADLVRRLPVGLEVAGMITIGSPLANGNFDVDKLRELLKEPPTNLAWWLNYWNEPDLVAAHRGASSAFHWMVDIRINTRTAFPRSHGATDYLSNEAVATAIGFALYGSTSKEVATLDQGVDIPLDEAEFFALLALRYAHLLLPSLKGDQLDRFAGALRSVQASAIQDIRTRNAQTGRPMPREIARLDFDFSDPRVVLPEPHPMRHISKPDAVIKMTVLAAENVIRPFEITVPQDKWQQAMSDLAAEMGLSNRFGKDVFEAAKIAQNALTPGNQLKWIKWGALGVGAAAIIVATGGLALMAAPGVAGAAAITSALAAFGPGGMIGGLLTAGTLVSAGGGGIVFGLASSGTTADALEAFVVRRLAAEILRQRQGLEPDPSVWRILAATEIEVRRDHERLDEFSDDSAPTLKELNKKIVTIERALKYMRDNGLEPGVPAEGNALD